MIIGSIILAAILSFIGYKIGRAVRNRRRRRLDCYIDKWLENWKKLES